MLLWGVLLAAISIQKHPLSVHVFKSFQTDKPLNAIPDHPLAQWRKDLLLLRIDNPSPLKIQAF